MLRDRRLPEEELLPVVSRLARRRGLHAMDWDDPLGWKVVLASLGAVDDPPPGNADRDGVVLDRLVASIAAGRLARPDVLDLAVRRAGLAVQPADASWWMRLIERLDPSQAEWAERSAAALDLVAAATDRAASLGMGVCRRLMADGVLSPEAVLPQLPTPLASGTVGVAQEAVKLLRAVVKAAPDSRLRCR